VEGSGIVSTEDRAMITDESEVEGDDKENRIVEAPQTLEWKQERRMDTGRASGASSMRSIPCFPYNDDQRDMDAEPEVELIILSGTENNKKYTGDFIGN